MLEGGAKNMPDAQSYARITYEVLDTSYAKGSRDRRREDRGRTESMRG